MNKSNTNLENIAGRGGRLEIYYGLEGYLRSMQLRVGEGVSIVKQIVNGKKVAKFHKATEYLVKNIIKERIEKGIYLRNLISHGDSDLEIEKSNEETLKEARVLPNGIDSENMIAIFNDFVVLTSLDINNSFTVVIKDSNTAKTFSDLFDSLWEMSKKV